MITQFKFVSVPGPLSLRIAPPALPAVLVAKVELVRIKVAAPLKMPPPLLVASLPVRFEPVSVKVGLLITLVSAVLVVVGFVIAGRSGAIRRTT